MEQTNLQKAFALFVGNDQYRSGMHKPFEFDDKIYATDAYALIRCNKSDCDFEVIVDTENKPPNVEGVIPESNCNKPLNIDKSVFNQYLTADETTLVGEDVVCRHCGGDGVVEWEFERWTREFECPACKGTGLEAESKAMKTGNKTFGKFLVKIGDQHIKMHLFYKLIQLQELIGGDITLIAERNSHQPAVFKVGICDVLIAPVYFDKDTEDLFEEVLAIE